MCCMYTVYSGMQEWVIQIPSIPILVSVLFPSLHLKYFRIKFLLQSRNESTKVHKPQCRCISLSAGAMHALCRQHNIVVKKIFILDVGMEKEQKQELRWRVSVLPIPAFQCVLATQI